MEPIIAHIQITVKDMSIAVPFYDKLLPLLDFDPTKRRQLLSRLFHRVGLIIGGVQPPPY